MLLCIGTTPTYQRTLVFEHLVLNEVNRAAVCDDYASGKSVNVARIAKLLGGNVTTTGFIGGARGRRLRDGLSEGGIQHDFVEVQPETRLCTTVIDRKKQTVTELVEESAAVASGDWDRLRRKVARLMKAASVCVLSGSLPPNGDVDFYADTIAVARRHHVPTILDARGEPLLRAMRETGFIVKLNREELSATAGTKLKSEAALKRAMRDVCPAGGQIIVTMGAGGAVAWDGNAFWRIPTPTVEAINPIGSGDSFAGGLAMGIASGDKPAKAYALAAACGAANAMHPRAGYLDAKQVDRLRKTIKVIVE